MMVSFQTRFLNSRYFSITRGSKPPKLFRLQFPGQERAPGKRADGGSPNVSGSLLCMSCLGISNLPPPHHSSKNSLFILRASSLLFFLFINYYYYLPPDFKSSNHISILFPPASIPNAKKEKKSWHSKVQIHSPLQIPLPHRPISSPTIPYSLLPIPCFRMIMDILSIEHDDNKENLFPFPAGISCPSKSSSKKGTWTRMGRVPLQDITNLFNPQYGLVEQHVPFALPSVGSSQRQTSNAGAALKRRTVDALEAACRVSLRKGFRWLASQILSPPCSCYHIPLSDYWRI